MTLHYHKDAYLLNIYLLFLKCMNLFIVKRMSSDFLLPLESQLKELSEIRCCIYLFSCSRFFLGSINQTTKRYIIELYEFYPSCIWLQLIVFWTSLVAWMVKHLPTMRATWGLILGLGRSPGEGNGNPLQYSWLENPMDGTAW